MKRSRNFFGLMSFVVLFLVLLGAFSYFTLTGKSQSAHAYGYTPPTSNIVGYIDAVDGNQVSGWACDQGDGGSSVNAEGRGSDGRFLGNVTANQSRPDAASLCNGNSNVGFTISYICDPAIAHDQEIHVIAHNYGLNASRELASSGASTSVTIQPCDNGVRS